jgi:Rps23 Pro-64 3,4-dihydroxylase Tpa1-like proline 4-hydroxylase
MKEELLNNGYISFDIDNELLETIYNESIDNESFNLVKVSHNSIAEDTYVNKQNFHQHEKLKINFIQDDNLEQIWHWKEDKSDTIQKLLYQVFSEYYDYKFDELIIYSSVTLFTQGCFINEHNDGKDPNRIAGILIYLNKDYDETNGGCLILENETKVVPEYGRVVIIDYTQNTVQHSVTTVLENDRKAICAFIHKK